MKAFLKQYAGIIFLAIIFALTTGLAVQSYIDLRELKVLQVKVAYQESELMELGGDTSILVSEGEGEFETLEYSPEVALEKPGPAFRFFQPNVGIGMVVQPVLKISEMEEHSVAILIAKVMCGSPADQAGFRKGDELVFFGGHDMLKLSVGMDGFEKLFKILETTILSPVGTRVQVVVRRDIEDGGVFYIDVESFTTIAIPPLEEWKTDCTSNSMK